MKCWNRNRNDTFRKNLQRQFSANIKTKNPFLASFAGPPNGSRHLLLKCLSFKLSFSVEIYAIVSCLLIFSLLFLFSKCVMIKLKIPETQSLSIQYGSTLLLSCRSRALRRSPAFQLLVRWSPIYSSLNETQKLIK